MRFQGTICRQFNFVLANLLHVENERKKERIENMRVYENEWENESKIRKGKEC